MHELEECIFSEISHTQKDKFCLGVPITVRFLKTDRIMVTRAGEEEDVKC
jgi:hypothetical protein